MTEYKYEKHADALIKAIKRFGEDHDALENFGFYIAHHGEEWFNKYANTFNGLIYELETFAYINGEKPDAEYLD